MAESEGFEPPIPFQVRQFSRLEPSTTRPALRSIQNTTIGKPPSRAYGFPPSTLPAPLPARLASSSESVPVLSAGSTVPSESFTTSSRGSLFTKPSGGVLPCAGFSLTSFSSRKLDAELRVAVKVAAIQFIRMQFYAFQTTTPVRRAYSCP